VGRGDGLIQLEELSLYRHRTRDSFFSGLERGENGVAGIVVNTPAMLFYRRGEYIEVPFELTMRPILVDGAKAAVVGDIGVDYRSLLP
jgi:hypothetical protein